MVELDKSENKKAALKSMTVATEMLSELSDQEIGNLVVLLKNAQSIMTNEGSESLALAKIYINRAKEILANAENQDRISQTLSIVSDIQASLSRASKSDEFVRAEYAALAKEIINESDSESQQNANLDALK